VHTTTATSTSTPDDAAAEDLRTWLALWRAKRDVFTLTDVNPNLVRYAADTVLAPPADGADAAVLVPLCGRTADLAWLAGRDAIVVGVEAVAEPLRLWAADNGGLEPVAEAERLTSYRSRWWPALNFVHGDIFDVHADLFGDLRFTGIWDRAALTALPPAFRASYAAHLRSLAAPQCRLLLEVLATDAAGVPGAMAAADAVRLLTAAGWRNVQVLHTASVRDQYPDFPAPGPLDEVLLAAEA